MLLAYTLVLTLPCVIFKYLPMVDLPQHEAVVSMMLHLRDHRWAFDSYYEWAPTRTLYLAPYLLAAALAHIMALHRAINCVALCSVIAYPVGVLLFMRALDRPVWIGLLSLPLVYNQSFFWGFINFNFAVGLAIITVAIMLGNWTPYRAVAVTLLALIVAVTHLYGLLLLAGYVALWLISDDRRDAVRRLPALMPAVSALMLWTILLVRASGPAGLRWPALGLRCAKLAESIAGGWRGNSEIIGLLIAAAAVAVFCRKSIPVTMSRWKALNTHERILWQLIALNLLLYFSMPELRLAAMKASFRHAQLAAMALPLALTSSTSGLSYSWARLVLCALGAYVIAVGWIHFRRFDAEARSYDAIADAVPRGARLVQLTYDRQGRVARVPAYLHFAAYAQAKKGGLLAVSFPIRFWNIPIKQKALADLPLVPQDLEWNPLLFQRSRLEPYFDYVIVRAPRHREPRLPEPFPYQLQLKNGPWQLLRKCE